MGPGSYTKKYLKRFEVMEYLEFPIIKESLPGGKRLSMNEYVKFVFLHLKYTLNKKEYERNKRLNSVNTPFFI